MNVLKFLMPFLLIGCAPITVELIGDTHTTNKKPKVEKQLEIESGDYALITVSMLSCREIFD